MISRTRRLTTALALCVMLLVNPLHADAPPQPDMAELPLSLKTDGVSGDATLQPADDAAATWRLNEGDNKTSLVFDLEELGVNPNLFDELHVTYRVRGSSVLFIPELTAFPVKGLRRHWYSKFSMPMGQWVTARFDLRLDDDGVYSDPQKDQLHERTLNLQLAKRFRRVPGEPAWREVDLRSIRFVRRVVGVDFDEFAATVDRTDEALKWTYGIEVRNDDVQPVNAVLRVDVSALKHFSADWTDRTVRLAPRERRTIPLVLSIPVAQADKQPPFYSEPVMVFAMPEGKPQLEMTPLSGYRPRKVWGTVVPRETVAQHLEFDKADRDKIVAQADKLLDEPWGVPLHGPASHSQGYYHSKTSSRPRPLSWFRHKDPKTGEILTDPRILTSYIERIHGANFDRANTLANAYLLTGNLRYASAVRDVYLEYARMYPYMRTVGGTSTAGRTRLGYGTLHTAFGWTNKPRAYAKVMTSEAFGEADRRIIEEQFLVPELRWLYGHDVEYSNMQVHHYMAYTQGVMALGKHWNLLGQALYGDHGFYQMVENTFSEDGIAHEAGVYHWFTVRPMIEFAEMMEHYGANVMTKRFKRVFDGTIAHTAEGVLLDNRLAAEFAYAYKVWRDPDYIPTLKRYNRWPPKYLNAEQAAAEEAKVGQRLTRSSLLESSGYVWLREQSPRGFRAISLNYIMQWDRLEHDRLHLSLFDPAKLTGEVGRINYGDKRAKMMYATLGHNSVVVDTESHDFQASRLAAFVNRPERPGALIVDAPASPLYEGVTFARVIALLDGAYFIGDIWHAPGKHTFDWPFYANWEPHSDAATGIAHAKGLPLKEAELPLGTGPGYDLITDAHAATTDELLEVTLPVSDRDKLRGKPNRAMHLTFAPVKDAMFVSAKAPRGYYPKPGPMMFVRQADRSTARFGCAVDATGAGEPSRIKSVVQTDVAVKEGKAGPTTGAWTVETEWGTYVIVVNPTGATVDAGGVTTREALAVEKVK